MLTQCSSLPTHSGLSLIPIGNPPKFDPPCTEHVLYVWCRPSSQLLVSLPLFFDSDDLARLDGLEASEANGHERNEVFQEDGFTTENNDCNFPMSEVLLIFKST